MAEFGIKHIIENQEAYIIMDGTYQTNEEELILLAAGICVLVENEHGASNRFLLIPCMLARAEDASACSTLLQYVAELGLKYGNSVDILHMIKGLYIDGSGGGEVAFQNILEPHGCRLHRDPQHIKKI